MSYLPSSREASLIDVFRRYPELSEPLHEFAEALMRGPSSLGPGERELIAAYVSRLNGCEFCRASHEGAAERFGIPVGTVDQLVKDIGTATVPEDLKALLRYVRKLNGAPAEITNDDVNAVLEAGWDETALMHAILICGYFNLMNRWVGGLGIEADPAIVRMAAQQLHARGYRAIMGPIAGPAAQWSMPMHTLRQSVARGFWPVSATGRGRAERHSEYGKVALGRPPAPRS